MKKISLNNIIKFRNKAEKYRKTFLNSIKKKSETKSDSGGNYWVRSLSALSNAVKLNSNEPIIEKITEIVELFTPDLTSQTKNMYERNLHILHNYEDYKLSSWLPEDFKIISKYKKKSVIYINLVPVQITPSQIFSFEKNNETFIGAIWFIAKLEGYKNVELGMFSEALYIYLSNNFKEKFKISEEHCVVVDVIEKNELTYLQLVNKEVKSILSSTLEEISNQI